MSEWYLLTIIDIEVPKEVEFTGRYYTWSIYYLFIFKWLVALKRLEYEK